MTDFGDDAGAMLATHSERVATEVLHAMLGRSLRKKQDLPFGALDDGMVGKCRREMARIGFDAESQDNLALDFKTVEWDRKAAIMTERFKEMGIPYAMESHGADMVRFTLHPASAPYVKAIADRYIESNDERLKSFTRFRFPNYEVLSGGLGAEKAASEAGSRAPEPERQIPEKTLNFDYRPYAGDAGASELQGALDAEGIDHELVQIAKPESIAGEAYRISLAESDAPALRRIADDLRRRFDPEATDPVAHFPDYQKLTEYIRVPSEALADERDVACFAVPDPEAARLIEEGLAQAGVAYEAYAERNGDTAFIMFNEELTEKRAEIGRCAQKIEGGEAKQALEKSSRTRTQALDTREKTRSRRKFDVDKSAERKYEHAPKAAPEQAERQAREAARARNAHSHMTVAKVKSR